MALSNKFTGSNLKLYIGGHPIKYVGGISFDLRRFWPTIQHSQLGTLLYKLGIKSAY